MENVVLTIHLILAVFLIGVVLLQRSEGGALGMGGGGGGVVSSRGAATALAKLTWALAAAFIVTSLALTILAARGTNGTLFDGITAPAPAGGIAPVEGAILPPAPPGAAPGTSPGTSPGAATDAPLAPLAPPPAQ